MFEIDLRPTTQKDRKELLKMVHHLSDELDKARKRIKELEKLNKRKTYITYQGDKGKMQRLANQNAHLKRRLADFEDLYYGDMKKKPQASNDIDFVQTLVGVKDLSKKSRKGEYVYARLILSYILRYRGYSLAEIGRVLNRDHSTIINSLRNYDYKIRARDSKIINEYLIETGTKIAE